MAETGRESVWDAEYQQHDHRRSFTFRGCSKVLSPKVYTFPSGPGVVFNEFAPPAFSVAARIKVYQRFMTWKSLPELTLAVASESCHHVLFAVPASEIQQINGLYHDH